MSDFTNVNQTQNQLHVDYDLSKIFIYDNGFIQGTLENTTGAELEYVKGTLIGRVTATNNFEILKSAAVDGSETPVGILAQTITLGIAATAVVNLCNDGDVVQEKVILNGADTLDTMIGGRSIRDKIAGDTKGIRLVTTDQLTDFDNQ